MPPEESWRLFFAVELPADVRERAYEIGRRLARAAGVPEAHLLEQPRLLAQAAKMGDDPRAKRALWPLLRALRRDPQ